MAICRINDIAAKSLFGTNFNRAASLNYFSLRPDPRWRLAPCYAGSMEAFAAIAEGVAATTRKTEKVRLVAEYLRSRPADEAAQAAVFLSGRAFPAWEERTLQVGGTLLWRALQEVSGKGEIALTAAYRRHGDLGAAAQDVLERTAPAMSSLSIGEVAAAFDELARTSTAARKLRLLQELLRRATALEAKYVIKIISGDLRIGLRESLVEEAIAKAFDEKAGGRSAGQHAAGRHQRHFAARCGAQAPAGADAPVPPHGFHAGQSCPGRGGGSFILCPCRGGRQI